METFIKTLFEITFGALAGFFIAYYYGYILRVILKIQPKLTIVFFNARTEQFVLENDNISPIFRIAIKKDKLVDTITFHFSHFYHNGINTQLNNDFRFHYYDKGWDRISKNNQFYIDHFNERNFLPFIEDVSFIPVIIAPGQTMGTRYSNTLEDLKQKLNIL